MACKQISHWKDTHTFMYMDGTTNTINFSYTISIPVQLGNCNLIALRTQNTNVLDCHPKNCARMPTTNFKILKLS